MASSPGGTERRKTTRYPCGRQTSGRVQTDQTSMFLEGVLDLSRGGACLVVGSRLDLGTLVQLDLVNNLRNYNCQTAMQVLRVAEYPGDNFVVGGAFSTELTDADVRELV